MADKCVLMDIASSLPVLKGGIRFEYELSRMWLIVEIFDRDGRETLLFSRKDGRWRTTGNDFISVHAIAARIFEYRDDPSQQEMDWMSDFVVGVGRLMDVALDAILDGARVRIDEREEMIVKVRSVNQQQIEDQSKCWSGYEQEKTFLYLMRHTNGLTKIGRSKNPRARERTLQAEDPRLEMIFCCETDVMVESRLHQIFDSVRVRGEWFDLMPHHVDWITFVLRDIRELSALSV